MADVTRFRKGSVTDFFSLLLFLHVHNLSLLAPLWTGLGGAQNVCIRGDMCFEFEFEDLSLRTHVLFKLNYLRNFEKNYVIIHIFLSNRRILLSVCNLRKPRLRCRAHRQSSAQRDTDPTGPVNMFTGPARQGNNAIGLAVPNFTHKPLGE